MAAPDSLEAQLARFQTPVLCMYGSFWQLPALLLYRVMSHLRGLAN
jgi:hypothetical protein